MEIFLRTFQTTWEIDIKARFEKGLITYERQLQSILYGQLKARLTNNYEVYIEPVIYQLDKIKPDIVITKGKKIISVMELKCKAWEYPDFFSDIRKLERFKTEIKINQEIVLGWIPKSVDWYNQEKHENLKLSYQIDEELQLIMALISRYDSDVVTKELKDLTSIDSRYFKMFLGYIDKDESFVFKIK